MSSNPDFLASVKTENQNRIAPSHHRIISTGFDFTICFLILRFLIYPLFIFSEVKEAKIGIDVLYVFFYGFGACLFFAKDFWGGKSFGKRFFNLRVAEVQEGVPTPGFRALFLRNLFLVLLPLELFLLVLNKHHRRWGDRFLGTFVIQEIKLFQVRDLTVRFLSILLIFAFFWISNQLLTPLLIRKTTAYSFAEKYIREDFSIKETLGDDFEIGFWFDTSYAPPLQKFDFTLSGQKKKLIYSISILYQNEKYSFHERKIKQSF